MLNFFFGKKKTQQSAPVAVETTKTYYQPTSHSSPTKRSKKCGHHDCDLSSTDTCCQCGDKRGFSHGYARYEDGVGHVNNGKREDYYCPSCKCKFDISYLVFNTIVRIQANSIRTDPEKSQSSYKAPMHVSNDPKVPPTSWFCPHSSIPTDCRVCGVETTEQRAIKDVINLGFNLKQVSQSLKRVKDKGFQTNAASAEVIASRILEEVFANSGNHTKRSNSHFAENVEPPKPVVKFVRDTIPGPQKDAEDDDNTCKICFENAINSVLIPCGHLALCYSCAISVRNTSSSCPICRKQISTVVQTFKA
jgi:hypothetical protein